MPFELSTLIQPLAGAIIGYVTNDIAIRMLFRPHRPKYIWGMKVPFTPGIIPKERHRIAETAGEAISQNLMNRETLEKTLLSADMLQKLSSAYDRFVQRQSANEETLRQFLGHYIPEKDLIGMESQTRNDLAKEIHKALAASTVAPQLADAILQHVANKARARWPFPFGTGPVTSWLAEPLKRQMEKHISEIVDNHSEEILNHIIANETENLFSTPMKTLVAKHHEPIAQLKQYMLAQYTEIIRNKLPRILAAIDISNVIRNRIDEMDMAESEKIILSVAKSELRAIVWLGALLGFVIGTLTAIC